MFIVIEGCDGSGKSSVVSALDTYLAIKDPKCTVLATKEPGGSGLVSAKFRDFILQNEFEVHAETHLFFANRFQHLHEFIVPNLNNGYTVICDRFNTSTYVYQCVEKGFDKSLFKQLEENTLKVLGEHQPLQFILDVDYHTANSRLKRRGVYNRFDSITEEQFLKKRKAYLERANSANTHLIDASRPFTNVYNNILNIINA